MREYLIVSCVRFRSRLITGFLSSLFVFEFGRCVFALIFRRSLSLVLDWRFSLAHLISCAPVFLSFSIALRFALPFCVSLRLLMVWFSKNVIITSSELISTCSLYTKLTPTKINTKYLLSLVRFDFLFLLLFRYERGRKSKKILSSFALFVNMHRHRHTINVAVLLLPAVNFEYYHKDRT